MNRVESVCAGVERLSLRTPTLLPATETNSYLVTHGDELYVVEPATPYEDEQRAMIDAIREKISSGFRLLGVIATHHHGDHVGAIEALRESFDAPMYAHPRTIERLGARAANVRTMNDGDALFDGAVRVLHTPGHAVGHLCLLSHDGAWLIAGDMVASVGTILIDVEDGGDMREYLQQLDRLAALSKGLVLPAHGAPIEEGAARLRYYVQHRLAREAKVLAAIDERWSELDAIVARAYDDTPQSVWPIAARSALAHLDKLEREERVARDGARWRRG